MSAPSLKTRILPALALTWFLLGPVPKANGIQPKSAAAPQVVFEENFERAKSGTPLVRLKLKNGLEVLDAGTSRIVAGGSLPGSGKFADRLGLGSVRCVDNGAIFPLTAAEAKQTHRRLVKIRFDLRMASTDFGGADIQVFSGTDPESTRGFNLLFNNNGSLAYYSGIEKAVAGTFALGRWIPVEIIADFRRHLFAARVGDVKFHGRFDKSVPQFDRLYFGRFGQTEYHYDNLLVTVENGPSPIPDEAAAQNVDIRTDLLHPLDWNVSPFPVGGAAQLFVDQTLVRDSERVWFTQHQGRKHPRNPVLKADQPWEGWRAEIFGNVIYDEDEKIFKMWYLPEEGNVAGYFDDPNVTCYATSQDGVHWQKPLVGTLKSKNGKPHNAVAHIHQASVFKDRRDPNPARRYKCIGWSSQPAGYNTFVSPDGLNWTLYSKSPIAPGGDVMTGYLDEKRGLYVAVPKIHPLARGHARRQFGTMISRDFIHWTPPALSFTVDLRDDAGSLARLEKSRHVLDRPDDPRLLRTEYYGVGLYPSESCTLAFPWIFTINNNARWGNHEGVEEIQLAISRDLVNWERPFRKPIIAIGDERAWDGAYHTTASTAIRVKDEVWLYYSGANYTHGTPALYRTKFEDGRSTGRTTKFSAAIGLVTWPLDRFVSADAGSDGGTLTTVPVRFTGKRLELNAATKPGGEIVVELLDVRGRPLPGLDPSQPVRGDSLRHTVRFGPAGVDVARWAGQPVTLRFRMKNAQLYSFAFREK